MAYRGGNFIFGQGFDIAATNSIIQDLLRFTANPEISVATAANVFLNRNNLPESHILHKAKYNDFSAPLTESAYKIVAELPEARMAADLGKKYSCRVIKYRGENLYGFICQNVGKMQAIRKLAEMLSIHTSEIMAFGDDENDIEMLAECGYGIAVENAIPEAKRAADFICESNNSDGVAKYIEKYLLNPLG